MLHPDHPFEVHRLLYNITYKGWDAASAAHGPPPVWVPTEEGAATTNAARFINTLSQTPGWVHSSFSPSGNPLADWPFLYHLSITEPEIFWPPVLRMLRMKFYTPPIKILESHPTEPDAVRWLPGARFNIAECALAGHDPDRPAILWAAEDSPCTIHTITRGELSQRAQHVADALIAWGLRPGDAVGVDMPMVPEAVIAYLGIILCGCIAVSIADSFVPREIESRLRIAKAKAIFTQDVVLRGSKALPLYARVVEAGAPKAIVLPAGGNTTSSEECVHFNTSGSNRVRGELRHGDLSWETFLSLVPSPPPFVLRPHVANSDDLSGILFSSGTSGEPKAIPWTHVSAIRCAADAFFHQDVRAEDAVCWPTSMGWMMGPWLVYACLMNGAAMVLFNGAPLGRPFGQFVAAARVAVLGLVPSVARAWRSTGCMRGLDWRCLRCFSSTGEASAAEEYLWLSSLGGYYPVIEYCGGTELSGAYLAGCMLQPQVPAAFSTPTIGSQPVLLTGKSGEEEVRIQPAAGTAASPQGNFSHSGNNEAITGEIALVMPQLGVSQRLLNGDHHKVYFAGMPRAMLRRHGDEMQLIGGGYCRAHGRVDDTMNLGGIKVSSVELERAVAEGVPEVAEAAAVAVPAIGGGPDMLVLFLVLDGGKNDKIDIAKLAHDCQKAISTRLNPLFKVGGVQIVGLLPRTASNKVMRRVLRDTLMSQRGADSVKSMNGKPVAKL